VEEEEEGGRLLRRPVWPGPTVEASSSAVSPETKERNTLAKVRASTRRVAEQESRRSQSEIWARASVDQSFEEQGADDIKFSSVLGEEP